MWDATLQINPEASLIGPADDYRKRLESLLLSRGFKTQSHEKLEDYSSPQNDNNSLIILNLGSESPDSERIRSLSESNYLLLITDQVETEFKESERIFYMKADSRSYNFHSLVRKAHLQLTLQENKKLPAEEMLKITRNELERRENEISSIPHRMIGALRHMALQGKGLGALLTQIEILAFSSRKLAPDAGVKLDALSEIFTEKDNVMNWINHLEEWEDRMSDMSKQEILDSEAINEQILKVCERMKSFLKIKQQKITFIRRKLQGSVCFSLRKLETCLMQILANAMKFSPAESTIQIDLFEDEGSLFLYVVNDIVYVEGRISGIPREKEELIGHPFIRFDNTYDEKYHEIDTGLGIGTSLVHSTLNKSNVLFFLFELESFQLNKNDEISGSPKVVAEMVLPRVSA